MWLEYNSSFRPLASSSEIRRSSGASQVRVPRTPEERIGLGRNQSRTPTPIRSRQSQRPISNQRGQFRSGLNETYDFTISSPGSTREAPANRSHRDNTPAFIGPSQQRSSTREAPVNRSGISCYLGMGSSPGFIGQSPRNSFVCGPSPILIAVS